MAIGDHLREALDLYGSPACPHTNACMLAAGEKGIDVDCHAETDWSPSGSIRGMSPLGIGPVLKDRTQTNYGLIACLSYIDDKGFGPSLVARNGTVRARMWQEMGVAAQCNVGDDASLASALDVLDTTLGTDAGNMKGDYVCGQFTLADVCWAGVCQVAMNMGKGAAISSRSRVNTWFAAVQSHPSTSKESINPFSCMATKADHDAGNMREIRVNAG
ncbi:MAG: glutathione S-transferase [Gammaproteobacteria bacterium]|jgi:glutathione S-transferase|tara:strand:- start:3110 stop:3760 length:651 start_codon:yes stop_codon:yes gene_type:complete